MIEVRSYRPVDNQQSKVIAYVDFYIPNWGLTLNDCRLTSGKNGGHFIGFPNHKLDTGNGDVSYKSFYSFDQEVNQRFQHSAKKAIKEHLESKT